MKQVLQNLSNGASVVAEVPCPAVTSGSLLIRTRTSLVSAGTERMLVNFGRGSLVSKVRQQPDKVVQVLEKVKNDGLVATIEAVRSKLDEPLALGYCNVGTVMEAGEGVSTMAPGDRVVSNGKHAEVVVVPRNLCARIPDGVDDDCASFTVLGAIALQGVRLIGPSLGETVAVTGLGLIGLLAVQILRAAGCRVLGIDMDPQRLNLARTFGAVTVDLAGGEDALSAGLRYSGGQGIDAVLICASTSSSEPVSQAAAMCRKRGRIVLVGSTGLELSRSDFYEKELTFQVSCSYGPGRYDPAYEQQGQDYPLGFVRWTEQRNFEAVLELMALGSVDVKPLISHRFDIADATRAYDLLASDEPSLGILLDYPRQNAKAFERTVELREPAAARLPTAAPVVAFVGAGNYGGRVLIPAFKKAGAELRTIVSSGGVTAAHYGARNGFAIASTDTIAGIRDPLVNTVVIATRHDTHAGLVVEALRAGKNVFVEKPLCLTLGELRQIEEQVTAGSAILMVGFNRRFSPHVRRMKDLLAAAPGPKAYVVTVNAGAIPAAHWTQDARVGGGRLIGEACHFVDLLRFLAQAPIAGHTARAMRSGTGDTATVTLTFADGSIGTIHYFANGHKAMAKERLEVFAAGRVLQLDNFRRLQGYGWAGLRTMRTWRQDKGQQACASAFVDAVRTGSLSPIPLAQILEVSRVSIEVAEELR